MDEPVELCGDVLEVVPLVPGCGYVPVVPVEDGLEVPLAYTPVELADAGPEEVGDVAGEVGLP